MRCCEEMLHGSRYRVISGFFRDDPMTWIAIFNLSIESMPIEILEVSFKRHVCIGKKSYLLLCWNSTRKWSTLDTGITGGVICPLVLFKNRWSSYLFCFFNGTQQCVGGKGFSYFATRKWIWGNLELVQRCLYDMESCLWRKHIFHAHGDLDGKVLRSCRSNI